MSLHPVIASPDHPFVMIGPGDGDTAHQTNESVSVEYYIQFIDLFNILVI